MSELKDSQFISNPLYIDAKNACVDIYISLHVSEMKGKPEYLKKAWSVGQEVYAMRQKGKL